MLMFPPLVLKWHLKQCLTEIKTLEIEINTLYQYSTAAPHYHHPLISSDYWNCIGIFDKCDS